MPGSKPRSARTHFLRTWLRAVAAVVTIVVAPPLLAANGEALPLRYEAEDQVLADGTTFITNALASGGSAVDLGTSGSIQWRIVAPAAGRYKLWLRYRAVDGDKAARLVVNGRDLGLGLPCTLEEWAEISLARTLAAGSNTIILSMDWPGLAVDYLRFDFLGHGQPHPLVELPVVSPRNNTRYLRNPVETRLQVDLGGHRLLDIEGAGRKFKFTQTRCDYLDDAILVHLPASEFTALKPGLHRLTLQFDQGVQVPFELDLRKTPEKCPWTIVTLDVNHGGATFMRLPTGRTLLIDTAKAEEADRVVIPFLERCLGSKRARQERAREEKPSLTPSLSHPMGEGARRAGEGHIGMLDYLIVTHYHDDHVGGLPAIRKRVKIGQQWDYKSFKAGDAFEVDGVKVKVLNAFENGTDENTCSLALRFEYRGFVYSHGADNYATNQIQQLTRFPPEIIRAHVYHANHHFHGSVDAGFLRTMDPVLALVSAEQAVYARGAYTTVFKQDVESYLKTANGRFREALVTYDVGHVVLRISDAGHWTCETTPALEGIVLP
jgi:beta-lactamase superfamily II metal-dependent hydrolase